MWSLYSRGEHCTEKMQKDIGKALIFAIGCNVEESLKKKRERKHKK